MMRKLLALGTLVVLLLTAAADVSLGQVGRSGLLSPTTMRQYGLVRNWYTQVALDRARGRVTFVTPYVSTDNAHTVYEVAWESGKAEFSELQRDAFDEPIEKEGALKAANKKIEELKLSGFDPKLITHVIPETTLYVATDRGVIHAIDAETGKTRWARAIGRTEHPNLEPGVNEKYLAVVNGSQLTIVNRSDGKALWSRELGGAPGAGAGLTDHHAFVPLVNGRIEIYQLAFLDDEKQRFRAPSIHVAIGKPLLQPIATTHSCAWVTDRGFMYIASPDGDELRYRTEAGETVVAPPTSLQRENLLFMASIDGYVYCVDEMTGDIFWRFSAGSPVSRSAMPVGDGVFVISDDGGMFKVDVESGSELWFTPRVKRYIAASENRVYCTDRIGRLMIIDNKTGGHIATLATEQLDLFIPNLHTDRIYLGSKSGLIQCFRESELDRALIYTGPGSEPAETIQVKTGGEKPAADTSTDPMPKDENPFGSSTTEPKGDNPFAPD